MIEYNEKKHNVEHFLNLIRRSQRGKFKLYIGMIAGVGKTYRMLQDAHELLRQGTDVRIGYVETHGREDTVRMLEGLPVIPRQKIFYKGKEVEEMDLDEILRLHPQIVIVDELAHTNIEGSRHAKRWQDVMELLDAGINVLSAVNIQHIESLNDEVYGIVGLKVQERLPDLVLQEADEVVNIDLSADELLDRLKAGKIYRPEKVATALNNFFQREHILQLRELALQEVAIRVGQQVENGVAGEGSGRSARICRVLVCVSSNSETQQTIIRKAARVAERNGGELVALYVQTPGEGTDRVELSVQRHLLAHLELAVQLGATVRQVQSDCIDDAILDCCRTEHITMLAMGHPDFSWPKIWWKAGRYKAFLRSLKTMKVDLIIFAS